MSEAPERSIAADKAKIPAKIFGSAEEIRRSLHLKGAVTLNPTPRMILKMMTRFSKFALALTLGASSIGFQQASADEVHSHAGHSHAGHDHEAMMKQEKKIEKALASLPTQDQTLAKEQRFCPVMPHSRLGSMGTPAKVMVEGQPVLVCCDMCKDKAIAGGKKTLKMVEKLKDVNEELADLPVEEREAIEAQKFCAVMNSSLLGAMGAPIKLEIDGESVYLCCEGCMKKAKANPAGTLAAAEKLVAQGKQEGHGQDHEGHDH